MDMRISNILTVSKLNNKSDFRVIEQKNSDNSALPYKESSLKCLEAYNRVNINFKGYYGDKQPAKKLFWIATGRNNIYRDDETEKNGIFDGKCVIRI